MENRNSRNYLEFISICAVLVSAVNSTRDRKARNLLIHISSINTGAN